MAAPTVQSVEQIVSELAPVYQGSIDVVNQRRAQLPQMFDAQRQALGAEKVQGFNQINNQMTGRGISFSGITADEQANYLSTKYLPGLTSLKQQENEQNLSLDEALAKINQDRQTRAMDTRDKQQSTLEAYLAEERQRAWEQQKFQAEQALERAKMAQQASIAAADRSAQYATPTTYSWSKQAKGGGYDTTGGVDLATAVKSQGGGLSNLVSLLQNGSASDKKAAQYYMNTVGSDPVKAYNYLVQNTGAFYKGGGF